MKKYLRSERHFWVLLIGFAIAFLYGSFSIVVVVLGMTLGWTGIFVLERFKNKKFSFRFIINFFRFLNDFIIDLAISNIQLAWDVITPQNFYKVRMIEVPVEDLSPAEIALLNHRITLTPGTIACELSQDGRSLLVHTMYEKEENAGMKLRRPLDILKGNL